MGHEYQATPSNRTLGRGCPTCGLVKRGKTRHVKHLESHESLDLTHSELVQEWDWAKNVIEPSDVTKGSSEKIWWRCEKGHSYQATVNNRVAGKGCPYCAGKKVLPGFNDLASVEPKIAAEWHPTLNGNLKPSETTVGSHKKVWWQCHKGHEWEAVVKSRTKQGVGCPYCSNKRTLAGYNDLASLRPDLASEWDPEKNAPLKPEDVVPGSGKKVWWKCRNGHSWLAPVYKRANGGHCPDCQESR